MSKCRLCHADELIPFLGFGAHPIAHHYLRTRDEKEYRHDVQLEFCGKCSLIQISDVVPAEILYTNYITLSGWKTHPHVPQLLELLRQETDISAGSRIIEVGSNDGSFLETLNQHGFSNTFGIEPARDACHAARAKGIETVNAYLTPELAKDFISQHGKADLVITRHVLEHISDLDGFSEALRELCRPGTHVMIEVPDFDFCLTSLDYSGIWEQHVNYFTKQTLRYFFQKTGIDLNVHRTFVFSGQAQVAIGKYVGTENLDPISQVALESAVFRADNFKKLFQPFKNQIHSYLDRLQRNGTRLALYGAGNRTCGFTNFLELGDYFEFVADDQAEKQQLFMPGSRLPIVAGEKIETSDIGLCLLGVNAEVEDKVIKNRVKFTENGGYFRSIHPPSEILLEVWSDILKAK